LNVFIKGMTLKTPPLTHSKKCSNQQICESKPLIAWTDNFPDKKARDREKSI